jgi:hypothetical protein
MFGANCDRAAPLLAKLETDGIGHMIDGKVVPSISSESFETNEPSFPDAPIGASGVAKLSGAGPE